MQWQLAVVLLCIVWALSRIASGVRRWIKQEQQGCGSCGQNTCTAEAADKQELVSLEEKSC